MTVLEYSKRVFRRIPGRREKKGQITLQGSKSRRSLLSKLQHLKSIQPRIAIIMIIRIRWGDCGKSESSTIARKAAAALAIDRQLRPEKVYKGACSPQFLLLNRIRTTTTSAIIPVIHFCHHLPSVQNEASRSPAPRRLGHLRRRSSRRGSRTG